MFNVDEVYFVCFYYWNNTGIEEDKGNTWVYKEGGEIVSSFFPDVGLFCFGNYYNWIV